MNACKAIGIQLVCAALTGCATLSPETAAEEATYQALAAADAAQTVDLARHPKEWRECNPALGRHPAPDYVIAWFAAGAVLHYAVTTYLEEHDASRWLRRAWQASGITVEGIAVRRNIRNDLP